MKNVLVGNLGSGATEDAIRTIFEAHGAVDGVNVVTDRETGRARGFAFVEMSDDGEGDRAIAALNGREVDGRVLNVNQARPNEALGRRWVSQERWRLSAEQRLVDFIGERRLLPATSNVLYPVDRSSHGSRITNYFQETAEGNGSCRETARQGC